MDHVGCSSSTLAPGPPGNPGGPAGPVGPWEETLKTKTFRQMFRNNLYLHRHSNLEFHELHSYRRDIWECETYGRSSSTSGTIVTTSSLQHKDKHDWLIYSLTDRLQWLCACMHASGWGWTHSSSSSTSTASLTRETTRSLRKRQRVSVSKLYSLNQLEGMKKRQLYGQMVGLVLLTIAPGVPFSPGAPPSP